MERTLQRSPDRTGLAPPPRERLGGLVRRWWRARGRHSGLRYWLWFRGAPALAAFVGLYAVNGWLVGWRMAYDVMIGIESPAATKVPALAWVLSLAGWLAGPAVAGAVVGYLVTAAIGARRRKPIDQLFPEADRA